MPTTRNIICPHCGKLARASEVILKSDRMAQKLGFRGIEELIIHYRADGLTYKEMHERTGISKRTLEDNAPEFLRGLRRQTKRQKESSRNNLKKAVAVRMKKYFDHPRANGKSNKQMSLEAMARTKLKMFGGNMEADELGRELESKQPKKRGGAYYTPKDLSCQVNILIKGIDCKDRTKDTSDWCDNCKEKYIKIIDSASGSGNFLNNITKNPPFSGKR